MDCLTIAPTAAWISNFEQVLLGAGLESNCKFEGTDGQILVSTIAGNFSCQVEAGAAIPAEARHAAVLEVEPGAPLLMANARTFEEAGKPIELSISIFRGDRYRFRTTLLRAGRDNQS